VKSPSLKQPFQVLENVHDNSKSVKLLTSSNSFFHKNEGASEWQQDCSERKEVQTVHRVEFMPHSLMTNRLNDTALFKKKRLHKRKTSSSNETMASMHCAQSLPVQLMDNHQLSEDEVSKLRQENNQLKQMLNFMFANKFIN